MYTNDAKRNNFEEFSGIKYQYCRFMSFNVGAKSFWKVSDYLFFRQLTVNATKPFSVFQEKTFYHIKSLISAENMISNYHHTFWTYLKVLSSEMDPAEIRLIR